MIIRSDIQDKTELFAYYKSSKNIIEDQLLKISKNKGFLPRVVSAQYYAQVVAEQLQQKTQGKVLCIRGEAEIKPEDVNEDKELDKHDWEHARTNIRNIASKYTGLIGEGSE